jgi:hypothetical protein
VSVSPSLVGPLDRVEEPDTRMRAGQPRRFSPAVLIGLGSAAVVLVLRYAGILIEPVAIVAVVLCFIFLPGPKRLAERYLLLFALVLGWLPLLGWVPRLGTTVDVPGIVLAIAVGVTCWHQVRTGRVGARSIARPSLSELIALIVGIAVTLWWALPITRLTLTGRLQFLFTGWDNDTHFAIFQQNVQLGSFIHVQPNLPSGGTRLGYDYPQGVHQAWAQMLRLWNPHPPLATSSLLNAYIVMLLLTTGSILVVGCMAISRLCRRDLFAALPAMAVIVALFGVGRFAPFNGFPNYELAIAACAVAVTLMVRPTLSPHPNFFAVAGMGLIVVYNWYPLIILAAPAIVVAAMKARGATSGRSRRLTELAIVVIAIAYVMPFTLFLHRGAKTLNETGGGVVPPWGLLMVCLAALLGVAIFRQATRRDWSTNLIIATTAILGAGAVSVLAFYEVRSTGSVSYYGQKFAAGVFAVVLTILVCVLASEVASSHFRQKVAMPMAIVATVVISIAALQVDGYVGPYSWSEMISGFSGASAIDAAGLVTHNDLYTLSPAEAASVLVAAQTARSKGDGQWYYIDPEGPNSFAFFAEWFDILKGNPTQQSYDQVGVALAPSFDLPPTPDIASYQIIQDFPDPQSGRIHLFVTPYIKEEMIHLDLAWSERGALLLLQTP